MNSVPASSHVVTVRSPEGVELELPLAGPAPRMAAYTIDLLFVAIMLVLLLLTFAMLTPLAGWISEKLAGFRAQVALKEDDAMAMLAPVILVVLLVLYFGELLYFSLWEIVTRGFTPGKYLIGLRVVGSEGQPLDAKAIIMRNVLRAVDVLPSGYVVGLIAMVGSRHGQRLGDHAAGTIVIRTDRIEAPAPLDLPADLEPLALSREQLSRLGPRELTLVRSTLRRLQGTSAANLQDDALAQQVADALVIRLGIDASEAKPANRMLQRVLVTAQRKLKA